MLDQGYLEHYVMGGNSKYQFSYDSLDFLVEKVIKNDWTYWEYTRQYGGQRRMLFIIGDHSSGKTKLVKDCLVRWFGQWFRESIM